MKFNLASLSEKQQVAKWLCLTAFLSLGLAIHRDYGIPFDEGDCRSIGIMSLAYGLKMLPKSWQEAMIPAATLEKLKSVPSPHDWDECDHGVAFEMPAALGEYLFGIRDKRDVYFYRHLLIFLVCVGGVIAVYELAARRFHDWRAGLLAALVLVLSPRLFADFFYNSKDAVLMAFWATGLNTLVLFVLRPTPRRAVFHALACALAIDVRILAVLLPLATVALLVSQCWRGKLASRELWRPVLIYFGLLVVFVLALWPCLWEAPIGNFAQAFRSLAHFRWNYELLYQGKIIAANQLPWHYAPTWIGITTPPLYLLTFGAGLAAIGWQVIRSGWHLYRCNEEWQDLLFLLMVLGPIVPVIVLHSALYDGWRQLYFIYPAFVLVATRGLAAVWQTQLIHRYWKVTMASLVSLSLLFTAWQMVRLHPYEHVYFNAFAGRKDLERRYELDYWCLSYRKGLEWIARNDNRWQIKVAFNPGCGSCILVGDLNRQLLPDTDRQRIVAERDTTQADYVITNYRWHPMNYDYPHEVAQIFAGDLRILSVFRLR